jgi:hypothetical protein
VQTQPDPELTDPALGTEIELLADLMEAAASATAHLCEEEVDAALHVTPSPCELPHRDLAPHDRT